MTYILSLKIFNANMSDSLLWTDLTLSQVMQVWDSFLFVTVKQILYLALCLLREKENADSHKTMALSSWYKYAISL